jgi:hypothetical protein
MTNLEVVLILVGIIIFSAGVAAWLVMKPSRIQLTQTSAELDPSTREAVAREDALLKSAHEASNKAFRERINATVKNLDERITMIAKAGVGLADNIERLQGDVHSINELLDPYFKSAARKKPISRTHKKKAPRTRT